MSCVSGCRSTYARTYSHIAITPQATPPGVVEREPGQLAGQTAALVAGEDLGMDQRDATALHDVVEEPCELVAVARLVSPRVLRIDDSRSHDVDGTWPTRPERYFPDARCTADDLAWTGAVRPDP